MFLQGTFRYTPNSVPHGIGGFPIGVLEVGRLVRPTIPLIFSIGTTVPVGGVMGVTVAAGFGGCLNTGCYYHQLLERVSFSRTLESLEQSDISVPRKLTQTRFNIFREAFISTFASRGILPNTNFTLWQDWKMKKTDVFFCWNHHHHHHHVCTPYSSGFWTLYLPRHQFKALLRFFLQRWASARWCQDEVERPELVSCE